MEFLRTYAKELVSLTVPVLSGLITWLTRNSVRLTYAMPHVFTFLVQQPLHNAQGNVVSATQTAHTQSVWFRNAGRAIAHNVEIVFNWKPMCLNIWPSRHFTESVEPDGRYVLTLATLAPREEFGFELLNINNKLPELITVRCDEGQGRLVRMYPQPAVARWRIRVALFLMFCGFVAVIYLLLIALQWLILKTPSAL